VGVAAVVVGEEVGTGVVEGEEDVGDGV